MAIIISHTKDLDGIASAAIVLRENPGSIVYLVDYAEKYVDNLRSEIAELIKHERSVIISDIGCNKKTIGKWTGLLSDMKKFGAKIIWLDHHQWDDDCLDRVKPYVEKITHSVQDKCAAEIVREEIGSLNDVIEERLAVLAHDSDFNLWKEPLSGPLSQLISYYHFIGGERGDELKKRLVALLANGIFWTFEMDVQLAEYREILRKDYEKLISTARVFEVEGFKIAVAFRGSYSGTEAANILFEKLGVDIAILVSSKGHISIRSGREDVNTKAIGEAFDGGGHMRHAAGGSIENVFPEPREDQIDDIAKYIMDKLSSINFRIEQS